MHIVDLNMKEPADEPTDSVNGVVIVQKQNGKLRIYLDPQPLIQAIKQEYLHIPTVSGAKYFLKLDVSLGSWQIKFDK